MVEQTTFIMIPYTVGYTIGKGFNSEVEDITKSCCACPFKDEAALTSQLTARAVVQNDETESETFTSSKEFQNMLRVKGELGVPLGKRPFSA